MSEKSDSPERYQRQRTRKADPRLRITGIVIKISSERARWRTRDRRSGDAEKGKRTTYVVKLGRERSLSIPAIQERQSAVKEAKLTVPGEERKGGVRIHPRNARLLLTNASPRTKIYAAKPPRVSILGRPGQEGRETENAK